MDGHPHRSRRHGAVSWKTHLGIAAFCLAVVFAAHATLFTLPPAPEEMDRFLPALEGSLWRSPSPVLTVWARPFARPGAGWPLRAAMLTLGALILYLSFLLAVELCGSLPGLPGVYAAFLVFVSPLVYIQSLLVHPELPAMAGLLAALWWFLRERHPLAAAAAAAAAFSLPAGVWVGLALGGSLLREKRYRRAIPYLAAAAVAALYWWWAGAVGISLRGAPAALFRLGRQLYFLFIGHGHWIAALGLIAAWRAGLLDRRRWRVALWTAAGFALLQLVPGRAIPERGFLPILPIFYTAAVAGLFVLPATRRWLGYAALTALLAAGHFVNPFLWPFNTENNLTLVEEARLRSRVGLWLDEETKGGGIVTSGPMVAALQSPRWGYVRRAYPVLPVANFDEEALATAAEAQPDLFILYSKDWDPPANLLRRREFAWAASRFLGMRTPLESSELETRLNLKRAAFLRAGRQWAEIYRRQSILDGATPPP